MKTVSCISHDKEDKDYILQLMDKAKKKNKLPMDTTLSALVMDCTIEYLESLFDKN